jgi:hypothetical protein
MNVTPLARTTAWSALFLVATSLALAQPSRERSGGRAILYGDADFRGDAIVLYPGDRIEDFARQHFDNGQPANDRVSSIRIEGRMELVLYADANFRGDALRLTDSVSNLADLAGPSRRGNWNDCISSGMVTASAGRRQPWPGGTGRGEVRGPRVELYSDANYRGSRLVLAPGDRVSNLADVGFDDGAEANDRVSSIRVVGGAALIVHADAGFRGGSLHIDESVPNLAFRDGAGGRSWNDTISSIVVTTRRAVGDAEAIVTKAYRELLGRDPDPAGLENHVRAMRDEGLSEDDLRNAIRRSREYRERDAERIIRRAYRDILKREPDEGGFADYKRLVLDHGWSESRVREAMRASDEFRQRGGG